MTEQQYRESLQEIRRIGAKSGTDLNAINRIFDVVDRAIRIERPVPTEHCLSTAHHDGHEWGGHESGTGYRCPGFDAADEHPPTREQIAEALEPDPANRDWQTHLYASRVLALIQNGADR